MNKKLFAELVESMTQMNEIVRGERAPSREFHVDAIAIKALAMTAIQKVLRQPKWSINMPPTGGAIIGPTVNAKVR